MRKWKIHETAVVTRRYTRHNYYLVKAQTEEEARRLVREGVAAEDEEDSYTDEDYDDSDTNDYEIQDVEDLGAVCVVCGEELVAGEGEKCDVCQPILGNDEDLEPFEDFDDLVDQLTAAPPQQPQLPEGWRFVQPEACPSCGKTGFHTFGCPGVKPYGA